MTRHESFRTRGIRSRQRRAISGQTRREAPAVGQFIVKIQRPIRGELWLFYNEDRSIEVMIDPGDDVRRLVGDELKVYALAHLVDDGKGGKLISIDDIAEDQPW